MSKESDNKAIVEEWFKKFWGNPVDLSVVDNLAAPDVVVHYPMHGPTRGRDAVKKMMSEFRLAFPDLNFWGVGELIAEGNYVVGRWDGGGTHTGPAFGDLPVGSLPARSGRKMKFTGTTMFRLTDGKIVEEIGEEGALTALQQLGLLPAGNWPVRSAA
jgi:predicted ester cyclase